jgi:hypothetical protein
MVGDALEPSPPFQFQEIVIMGINGTGDRVIFCNDRQRLHSDLPILPFNHDIVETAIVVLVM